jgi:hypothetical protein
MTAHHEQPNWLPILFQNRDTCCLVLYHLTMVCYVCCAIVLFGFIFWSEIQSSWVGLIKILEQFLSFQWVSFSFFKGTLSYTGTNIVSMMAAYITILWVAAMCVIERFGLPNFFVFLAEGIAVIGM